MSTTYKIIIIGGEGTATNIAEAIIDDYSYTKKFEFIGFANDYMDEKKTIYNYPILTKIRDIIDFLSKYKDVKIIFSLYKPLFIKERAQLLDSLSIPEEYFINFIHHSNYISKSVKIGLGNVFLPNSTILNNVSIGNFNIINSNCTIEHDSIIDSYNFIAAGAIIGSSVNITKYNFIGLNSGIKENIVLPESSFIGMGSNLISSPICSNEIWYGNPARKTNSR